MPCGVIECYHVAIAECSEEEPLVWTQLQILGYDTVINGFDVFRAFGSDDDMGTVQARCWLAQHAGGHQCVFVYGTVVIHQHDVDAWRYVTVLECIIEQDDLGVLCRRTLA